jgi:hypothetical protein
LMAQPVTKPFRRDADAVSEFAGRDFTKCHPVTTGSTKRTEIVGMVRRTADLVVDS